MTKYKQLKLKCYDSFTQPSNEQNIVS